jgi:hypothetical protein
MNRILLATALIIVVCELCEDAGVGGVKTGENSSVLLFRR